MKASLFYLPSIGNRAEIEAGMAGMNPHFYQRMLQELTEQIKLGDELGYDSVSFTEHHFHIEGFGVSNNPVLLDLYFAMQTKRIRVWRRPARRKSIEKGYALTGTVGTVTRTLEKLRRRLPIDWVFCYT